MQILYFLLVLSFIALVCAAITITRHIHRNAAAATESTSAASRRESIHASPTSRAGQHALPRTPTAAHTSR